MPTIENTNKVLQKALLLGLATLATNTLCQLFSSEQLLPIGNIFLFVSASAFGVYGAMISAAVGVIPEAFFSGAHLSSFRILIICLSIGYFAQRAPKLPSFVVSLVLWCLLFAPVLALAHSSIPFANLWSAEYAVMVAIGEIIMILVSNVFLLHPVLWATLTNRPRHIENSYVLMHVTTLVGTTTMYLAFILPHMTVTQYAINAYYHGSAWQLIMIALLISTLAPLLGWKLASAVEEFGSNSIFALKSGRLFSGLSSDYWRRQDSTKASVTTHIKSKTSTKEEAADESVGVCAVKMDGTISFVNKQFLELMEISHNQVIGKDIRSLDMSYELCQHILNYLESEDKEEFQVAEIKQNQLPDQLRFFEVSKQHAYAEEESDVLDNVIFSIKEITERRTVESHLLQSQKVKSLGEVVGGLAHAFNNYLTNIMGQASFARRTSDRNLINKSLDEIMHAVDNASKLVWKLLEFAEGRPDFMKEENLTSTIENHFELLEKIAGEKIELNFNSAEENIGVMCDTNLVIQALTNIVINSKESYSENGGKIAISLDTEEIDADAAKMLAGAYPGKFARLRVQDQGIGMNPEVLAKAFEPLYSSKRTTGQAGLGLSIVFAIIRAHDGFLTAESHPQKGTTISLYLPYISLEEEQVEETALQASHYSTDSEVIGSNHEKILVVEDEDSVRELVAKMLSTLGYDVTSCGGGHEALEICADSEFDLVVVDMMMPKMDGIELIQKLKSNNENTNALIMTGYGMTPKTIDNVADVLAKPFDINTLAEAITTSLDKGIGHG